MVSGLGIPTLLITVSSVTVSISSLLTACASLYVVSLPYLLGLLLELPVHVVDALLLRGQCRPQVLGRAQFNRKQSCIQRSAKVFVQGCEKFVSALAYLFLFCLF